MVSLAEYFQAFHSYAYENALTASARTLYYTILGEFNAMYWKRAELSKSVREMKAAGGFASVSVVQRAKAELGTENIIHITKNKKGDVYTLIDPVDWKRQKKITETNVEHQRNSSGTLTEQARNSSGTLAEHSRNTSGTAGGVSYYAYAKDREDGEDWKDGKTFSPPATTARARVISARDNLTVSSDAVQQAWFECEGETPKGSVGFGLIDLEKAYGADALITAIYDAHKANTRDRLSFNFVKTVLERQQKGRKPSGRTYGESSYSNFNDPDADDFPAGKGKTQGAV